MKNEVINLKFEMPHFTPALLKESEINVLNNIVHRSRVGDRVVFYKYCILNFNEEDKQHWYPNPELIDKFKRSKVNCICYKNINKAVQNPEFDYFFVYQLKYKDTEFYGIIAYDENENRSVHYYGISYDYTNLLSYLLRLSYRDKEQKNIA